MTNQIAVKTQVLTQLEFDEADFPKAEALAAHLGYEQTAYTSTSALWGLFCLPENPARNPRKRPEVGGCIIKTKELGLLFVQDLEDFHMEECEDAQLPDVSTLRFDRLRY